MSLNVKANTKIECGDFLVVLAAVLYNIQTKCHTDSVIRWPMIAPSSTHKT